MRILDEKRGSIGSAFVLIVSMSTACGGRSTSGEDSIASGDPWIDGELSTGGTEDEGPPPPPKSEEDEDEDEDEGDESNVGTEVFWWGEGEVQPGQSYAGWGEFIALVDGNEVCVMGWTETSNLAAEGCDDCAFAFEVARGEVEIEIDENEACTSLGGPVGGFKNAKLRMAVRGETLLHEQDGVWVEKGEAEYDEGEGVVEYFWEEREG